MLKKSALALFNVLCIVLIVVSAITVSAVGEGDVSSSQESSEVSSVTEQPSSSVDSDSVSTDSDTSGAESDDLSSDDGSSDSSDSSESDTSSIDGDSSEESSSDSTSSKNTSSKKPVHTTGGHGNTFISQDVTTGTQSVITSSAASTVSADYNESYDDDEEHYVARSKSAASAIYKLIWIPIVLIVLCVGGLVTANVMFRKKYPKKAEGGASRRSANSRGAVRRRK